MCIACAPPLAVSPGEARRGSAVQFSIWASQAHYCYLIISLIKLDGGTRWDERVSAGDFQHAVKTCICWIHLLCWK